MKRWDALAAFLLAVMSAAGPARAADPSADDKARARSHFDAALQAYSAAQYLPAAEEFLKAYKLLPSDSLIFSAAQAYRRQFYIDQSPEHLREALRLYRDYLTRAEQGRRRQEASEALGDASQGLRLRLGDGPTKSERSRPTQLLVTSRTPGAQTSIDGGLPRKVPLVIRVAPGEHSVVVRAPGYFEESSKTIAVPRETISVNVLLRPKPVDVHVRGDNGAKVYANGQLLATLPAFEPLKLVGGDHHLSVVRPGHVPYSTPLSILGGSRVDLDVALPPTAQRYAAVVTLGLAGASVIASGVLAGLAGAAHAEAKGIDDARKAGEISGAQRDTYNAALERRDVMITGAASLGGGGALLGMLGLGLYLFDNPDVAASGGGSPSSPGRGSPSPDTELLIDGRGVSIRGSF